MPERLDQRRVRLDALLTERGFQIGDQTTAEHGILFGSANQLVQPEPGERQLLRSPHPPFRCRREAPKQFADSDLVVVAHGY